MTAHSAFEAHEPDEPDPLVHEVSPPEAYPVTAMGPFREAVEAIHDRTQAPPAVAAHAVLGAAALAVQPIANVETLGGPSPVSLFVLTIAQSGERKSACDRLALDGVRAFEQDLVAEHGVDTASWRNRHALWETERKRILGPKESERGAREADLTALGAEPQAPVQPIVVTPDPTVEGLVKNMAVLRPSLGLFSDEGGAFLGGVGMNSENKLKTISTLSAVWDGSPVSRLRAGDGASLFLGRRVSVHLMAQPVAASTLLADPVANGQGILARFLTAEPASTIGTRTRLGWSPESDAVLARFKRRLGDLLRRQMPQRADGGLDPRLLPLSTEAREMVQAFYIAVETEQADGGVFAEVRPFASKAPEHACRLAAVMTLFASPEAAEVTGATMRDALTLVTFYVNEAVRLARRAAISVDTAEAEQMRRWLVGKWSEPFISVTDAMQRGPFKDSEKVRRVFARLAANRWLLPMTEPVRVMGKRRREGWRVVRGTGLGVAPAVLRERAGTHPTVPILPTVSAPCGARSPCISAPPTYTEAQIDDAVRGAWADFEASNNMHDSEAWR
jgi:hypothetical protein